MLPLGLEPVLVGDVDDGVGDPVGAHVRVGPPHDQGLVVGAGAPQFPGLLVPEAVAGLHAEKAPGQCRLRAEKAPSYLKE